MENLSIFDNVCRGSLDPKGERNYSGIFFANTFKVSNDIEIVGATFLGRKEKEPSPYNIFVTLQESQRVHSISKYPLMVLMEKTKFTVEATQDSAIFVKFPVPVKIPKYVWIDFSFKLEHALKKEVKFGQLHLSDLNKRTHTSKSGLVTFDFLRGCRQMQYIHFLMP